MAWITVVVVRSGPPFLSGSLDRRMPLSPILNEIWNSTIEIPDQGVGIPGRRQQSGCQSLEGGTPMTEKPVVGIELYSVFGDEEIHPERQSQVRPGGTPFPDKAKLPAERAQGHHSGPPAALSYREFQLKGRAITLYRQIIRTFPGRNRKVAVRRRCLSNMRFVVLLAMMLVAASGAANAQYHSNGKVPPREQLDGMVADTIQAYNNALQPNDFTAFHSWVSTRAQEALTAEKMREMSKPLRDRKVNLVVLKGRKPTYAREPEIVEEGGTSKLRVQAVYKIKETITVKLQYVTEKQLWRLLTIDVSLE
jgi:hypothetical protein